MTDLRFSITNCIWATTQNKDEIAAERRLYSTCVIRRMHRCNKRFYIFSFRHVFTILMFFYIVNLFI